MLRYRRSRIRVCTFAACWVFLIFICYLHRDNLQRLNDIDDVADSTEGSSDRYVRSHLSRHLLQAKSNTKVKNSTHHRTSTTTTSTSTTTTTTKAVPKCEPPDIEQFPRGLLTRSQRQHGAILLHFLIAAYMFIALAIVCDEYFVPSLQEISQVLKLKEDVAGATFMAIGSSAPELATSIISLFVAKDVDIGIGTVVGSAVFNIMFVIGIVGILSGLIIYLSWYPLLRDSIFYLVSIIAMIFVIMDEKVYLYEAVIFLMLYAVYIVILVFNSKIESWCLQRFTFMSTISNKMDPIDGNTYATLEENTHGVNMSGFSSSSTLNQVETASGTGLSGPDAISADKLDLDESHTSPFQKPDANASLMHKCRYFVCLPLVLLLHVTVPDCKNPAWKRFYILTFVMSLVWLSVFSYFMVWMITIIGYTFGIPDTIMGITLIAFGASVPDALASLLVAKNGQGDMAISNAIGSNVFDILICLGVPWLIKSLSLKSGTHIVVKSKGLTYSTISLLGTVIILIVALKVNKWQLDKRLGIFFIGVYIGFIVLTSLYEMNILGSNHLPMCFDSNW